MISKKVFIISAMMSSALSANAFAYRSETAEVPHRVVHKHHVAKNVKPNTASDVDRDAGMYVVKPVNEPEYFGHATGSDGSMPSE